MSHTQLLLTLTLLFTACQSPAKPQAIAIQSVRDFQRLEPKARPARTGLERTLSIDCQRQPLGLICHQIQQRTGWPVTVDQDLKARKITVSLQDIKAVEALQILARLAQAELFIDERQVELRQRARITLQFEEIYGSTLLELLAAYLGYELKLPENIAERALSADLKDCTYDARGVYQRLLLNAIKEHYPGYQLQGQAHSKVLKLVFQGL